MAIAVAGQSAYDMFGEEAILTEEFLSKDFRTWESGLVSINHENNNSLLNKATISDVEYEAESKLVWATFNNLPEKALSLINSDFYEGVSQECFPLEFEGNKIKKGYGVGATLVTYPYKPAATPEMGVGVRPSTGSMMAATLSSKYPQYKQGGETTPDEPTIDELKSTIEELKSKNAKLEADLLAKDKTMESTVEKAVRTALESHDKALKERAEYNDAVKELSSFMKEKELEEFLSANPAAGIIRATAAAMKATVSSHIGAGGGSGSKGSSGKAQSTFEAGKDVYAAAGITPEDLEKYGGLE